MASKCPRCNGYVREDHRIKEAGCVSCGHVVYLDRVPLMNQQEAKQDAEQALSSRARPSGYRA